MKRVRLLSQSICGYSRPPACEQVSPFINELALSVRNKFIHTLSTRGSPVDKHSGFLDIKASMKKNGLKILGKKCTFLPKCSHLSIMRTFQIQKFVWIILFCLLIFHNISKKKKKDQIGWRLRHCHVFSKPRFILEFASILVLLKMSFEKK